MQTITNVLQQAAQFASNVLLTSVGSYIVYDWFTAYLAFVQ